MFSPCDFRNGKLCNSEFMEVHGEDHCQEFGSALFRRTALDHHYFGKLMVAVVVPKVGSGPVVEVIHGFAPQLAVVHCAQVWCINRVAISVVERMGAVHLYIHGGEDVNAVWRSTGIIGQRDEVKKIVHCMAETHRHHCIRSSWVFNACV